MVFPLFSHGFPCLSPAAVEASDFKERQRLRGEESWASRADLMIEVFAAGEGQGKPLLVVNGG